MRVALTVTAIVLGSGAVEAACLKGEQTFMSCRIEGSNKQLRVCFDDRIAFYRFGVVGEAPELELAEPLFTLAYTPWPGTGRAIWEAVAIENAGYVYEVSAGFERMFDDEEFEDIPHRGFGGVRVTRGEAVIADLSCDRATVDYAWGEGLFEAKQNLGLAWNHVTREWVELPD